MHPLIITCAITGAETLKSKQPALPITPEEQAQSAKEACDAGASIIHLHVRDESGNPTQDLNRFEESIQAIRSAVPDVILQISTGGAVGESLQARMQPLSFKPEMATLNMGSMNFGDALFLNSLPDIKEMASQIYSNQIVPELEVYDLGMLETTFKLLDQGILKNPLFLQFVLGVPGGVSGDPDHLDYFLKYAQSKVSDLHWAVAGIGRYEFPLAKLAIQKGGHVRVGFEDNIYLEKGVLAKSNAQLVDKVVGYAKEQGRAVATCAKARELLQIQNS